MPLQLGSLTGKLNAFIASQKPGAKVTHQLAPVTVQIGKFPGFIAKQQETLTIKEKAFSFTGGVGDSFDITNAQGQPVLTVKGRHKTLSGRKSILDVQGNHLFDMYKEHFKLHATFVAEDPSGVKFLSIKSSMKLLGSKATGTFVAADGQQHTLSMTGDMFSVSANIVLGEGPNAPILGVIDRKLLNARELLRGAQTYDLTVAPGVDIALLVAFCVANDEKNNDK